MNRFKFLFRTFFILSVLILSPVWKSTEGAVPKLINFQGILKDGSGNPVTNGSYSTIFTIYDAPAGGTTLWAETTSVTTSSGLFSVLLGSTNPVPDSAFNNSNRWLGTKVSTDPEMIPRQQLVSLSYAYRVNSVDSALGGNLIGDLAVSGKAGVGTTNLGSPFVVQGASNWGVAEVIGNDGFNNETSIGFRTTAQGKGALGTWVLGLNNNSGPLNAFSLYAANGIGFGSQAITVLTSGNVGIGANSPANKLDIEGGTAIGATYAGTNTAPTNGLLVEGNVGIGTASPAARLHVHDPSNSILGSRLTLTQASGGSTILDGLALICTSPKGYLWNYENGPSIFGTNNAERMRIDSAGNVGIGIDAPTARLHVGSVGSEGTPAFIAGTMIAAQATNPDNWTHMAIISGSIGQARLNFGDGFNDDQGSVAYNNSNDAMFFVTAAAERMRITSTGNVGIGTTAPTSRLQVNGALATVVNAVGVNTTLTDAHSVVLVDASGGPRTITLPTAVGINGRQYVIKKSDGSANSVTIDANGAENIDGALTFALPSIYKYVVMVSNGGSWWIIGNN